MKAIGRFLVAATMVVVATSGALADATWKAAVDGDWATASNWSTEAVPLSTERAAIMQQTAGYTVTLGSAQTIRGLTLAGASATLRPVLEVNDALVVDGASLAITNAQLKVNAGGSLELRNTGAVIKQNEDSTGSLWINGGALYATNGFTGIAISSGNAWASRFAKFRMTGGTANLAIPGSCSAFAMKADKSHQHFEMSGGQMTIVGKKGSSSNAISSMGYGDTDEHVSISGDSEIAITNACIGFGWGVATIGGNAKLTMVCNDADTLQIGPLYSDAGKKAVLNLKDNSQFKTANVRTLLLGLGTSKSVRTIGEMNISGGTHVFGRYSVMGGGTGTYTINISGGHTTFDQYGVRFSAYPSANPTRGTPNYFANTTTVNVTSGVLYTRCSECRNNSARNAMWGCVIGDGSGSAVIDADVYDGRLNLSGSGIVTNGAAPLIVGVANGRGTIAQAGGTFVHEGITYGENVCALAIGVGGGAGSYDLSAGSYSGVNNVYVGGCLLSVLNRTGAAGEVPRNGMKESNGRLSVSGTGAFTTTKDLYVGTDGAGEIALAGTGSITIGGTLVLSNDVSSAVNVTLSGTTAPTLTARKLDIAADASLRVDVSAFEGGPGYYKILGCTTRTGTFANVNLVGDTAGGKIVQGRGSDPSIFYCIPKGMMLIVR